MSTTIARRQRTYYSRARRAAVDDWLLAHETDIAECAAAERVCSCLTARLGKDLPGISGKFVGQRIRQLFRSGRLRLWDGRRRRRPPPADLPAGGLTGRQWDALRAGLTYVLTLHPDLSCASDAAVAAVLAARGHNHVSVAAVAALRSYMPAALTAPKVEPQSPQRTQSLTVVLAPGVAT